MSAGDGFHRCCCRWIYWCQAIITVAATGIGIGIASAEDKKQIPGEFRGIWGLGSTQCSAKDWRNVDNLIEIGSTEITYWESECRITSGSGLSDDLVTLKLKLNCSGEGEEWQVNQLWKRLVIDNAEFLITVTPATSQITTYRKCQ